MMGNHATRNYDIMAPGQYIYSTYLNQSFAYMNGTSMASPTVAGVAALLMTKLGGFSVYDAPTISKLLISQNPLALGKVVNTVEYRYPKLNALNTLKIKPVINEVLAFNQYGIFNFTVFGDYFLPGLQVLIDDVMLNQ
jgi:subtilisin family serine protease